MLGEQEKHIVITFDTIEQLRHPADKVLQAEHDESHTQEPLVRVKFPGQLRQPEESQVAH